VDRPAVDEARGVRRLLAVLVVLALAAAGAAFALTQLLDTPDRGSTAGSTPSIFPASFRQAGFITGAARLVRSFDGSSTVRRVTGGIDLAPGTAAHVVVRCDHGTIRVAMGAATTSQKCSGRPDGVIALRVDHRVPLVATVNAAQRSRWGVAVYR